MTILLQNSRSFNTSVAEALKQLDLIPSFDTEGSFLQVPKSIAAKLAPANHHRSVSVRYWLACGFDRRLFGSLYGHLEVNHILAPFKGWHGPIITATFDIVAAALPLRHQSLGVAV